MISAVHAVIYTKDAEADRAFFRDVLGFPSVDAGGGWLIFALPPAELGFHPNGSSGTQAHHEVYLMCNDVEATVRDLKSRGVVFSKPVQNAGFGLLTFLRLPGGSELGLYQPKHPSPLKAVKVRE